LKGRTIVRQACPSSDHGSAIAYLPLKMNSPILYPEFIQQKPSKKSLNHLFKYIFEFKSMMGIISLLRRVALWTHSSTLDLLACVSTVRRYHERNSPDCFRIMRRAISHVRTLLPTLCVHGNLFILRFPATWTLTSRRLISDQASRLGWYKCRRSQSRRRSRFTDSSDS
jgi:hypothetical protein